MVLAVIGLVLFDLDDTLIDTTGQLLPAAHRDAAQALIRAGLPGTLEAVASRRAMILRGDPTVDADLVIATEAGCGEEVALAGRRAFLERRILHLDPLPGALPTLGRLRPGRRLHLVTAGHGATQRRKVELAGLGLSFDAIEVIDAPEPDKEPVFRAAMARWEVAPERVVVVGDRLDREIAAGRRLGCWTVRMEHGEGAMARPRSPEEQPHYTIGTIEGLVAVIDDIEASGEEP